MTRTNRLASIVMTLALLLATILASCAPNITTSTQGSTTVATSGTTTSGTTTSGTTMDPSPTTFDKAVATLTYLCQPAGGVEGPASGWLDDYIIKKTGVHVERIIVAAERMQAMLASGELADVISFQGWENYESAVKGSMLVSLDDHLDRLPNAIETRSQGMQYMRDDHSAGTGKLYGLPDVIGRNTMSSTSLNQYAVNLRWDLYQSIGAPEVKTLEDFLPVLKQMQDQYPKTEDGQKVYAFSMYPEWDTSEGYFWHASSFLELSGYSTALCKYFMEYDLVNNNATEILKPDSLYMRMINFYYQANQMGLLDPDSLTQTYENATAKLDAGTLLSAIAWNSGQGFNKEERVNGEPPIGFMPVIFDEFIAFKGAENSLGSNMPMAIGAATNELDACLRLLDLYASEEFFMTFTNGPQGDFWDVDQDGKAHATKLFLDNLGKTNNLQLTGGGTISEKITFRGPFQSNDISPKYGVAFGMGFWPDVIDARGRTKLDEAWTNFYGYDWPIDLVTDKNMIVKNLFAFSLRATTPDDINTIRAQVADIIINSSWRMIYAKDQAEYQVIYDEMITQSNGLGIDQVVAYGRKNLEDAVEKAAKYK